MLSLFVDRVVYKLHRCKTRQKQATYSRFVLTVFFRIYIVIMSFVPNLNILTLLDELNLFILLSGLCICTLRCLYFLYQGNQTFRSLYSFKIPARKRISSSDTHNPVPGLFHIPIYPRRRSSRK